MQMQLQQFSDLYCHTTFISIPTYSLAKGTINVIHLGLFIVSLHHFIFMYGGREWPLHSANHSISNLLVSISDLDFLHAALVHSRSQIAVFYKMVDSIQDHLKMGTRLANVS